MSQLAKYAYANAKIRAMLSRLLDERFFDSLLAARTIEDAAVLLKNSPYASVFEAAQKDGFDIHGIEEGLTRFDEDVFLRVAGVLLPSEKDFVSLLLEKYEIEALKLALRLWYRKAKVDPAEYLPARQIVHPIDYRRILAAKTIEELIVLLSETPYFKPLARGRDKFKEKDSLFYLEVSLDIDYYGRIIQAVSRFSPSDRNVALKILGIEIDIENINWLIRLRKYYNVALGDMLEWVIPGGTRVDKDLVRGAYAPDGLGKIIEQVARGPYAAVRDLTEQNISLIENFLYQALLREVRRALSGFPFSIGTVLGYLTLKRRETRNVISILNAARLGWKKDETAALLNL